MSINSEIVEDILKLSSLEVKEKDKKDLLDDLNKILKHMESLDNVGTKDIEDMFHGCFEKNYLREDKVVKFPFYKKFLETYGEDSYFSVPEIISKKRKS